MAITIKANEMQYKDMSGVYRGLNAVSEKKTADQVADLDACVEAAKTAVNTLNTQKNEIAETIASMAELGTDSTLSTPGMAADAAACGDLKSAINEMIAAKISPVKIDGVYIKDGTNLLPAATVYPDGYYVKNDQGELVWGDNPNYTCFKIDATEGRYSFSANSKYTVVVDNVGKITKYINYNTMTVVCPENTKYLYMNVHDDNISTFMVRKGSGTPTQTKYEWDELYLNTLVENLKQNKVDKTAFGSNIVNKATFLDKTLISFVTGIFDNYDNSIITGLIPVDEGETYTITNGKDSSNNQLYIKTIVFYDANKQPVCAYPSYDGMEPYTGIVDVTGTSTVVTFYIRPNTGIASCCWYITKSTSSNYYGSHDGLSGIVDSVQMNYGTVLLPYKEYTNNINDLVKNVTLHDAEIENLENRVSNLEEDMPVKLVKSGSTLQVISAFLDEKNIKISCSADGSNNGAFNMENYYLVDKSTGTETLFKEATDDICPLNYGGGYIGGNHGYYYLYRLTASAPHGLTETNIGQIWTDSNDNGLLIIRIPSSTTIDVCCPTENASTSFMKTIASPASISKGGTTISISSSERKQMYPSIQEPELSIFINGGKEITEDGSYNCRYVDFVESYGIIYPPSMFDYLELNVGNNNNDSYYSENVEKYCTIRNTYRFTEKGCVTIFVSADFYMDVYWSFFGITQSSSIGDYIIVPNSIYDDMTALSSNTIEFLTNTYRDANNPPNRFYQFADQNMSKGMLLGYNVAYGDCTPEKQKVCSNVGFINGQSHKMYPKVAANIGAKSAFSVNGIAYRIPLVPYDSDLKAFGWYYVNDDIYLVLDVHSNIDKVIELPGYMNGMIAEIVESFGSISIPNPFVTGNGLKIKVSNGYGSAIIKLKK